MMVNNGNIWRFLKMGYPKIDGLQWKILLKWMIWGYPHFRKPSYIACWNFNPEKDDLVTWDDEKPKIWEKNKKCSQTTNQY